MSEIATGSIGVGSKAASDPSSLAYAGFWRRSAAAILDFAIVAVVVSFAWSLLALAIGDPFRFKPPGFVDEQTACDPPFPPSVVGDPDAAECGGGHQVEDRVCTITTYGLWTRYDHLHDEWDEVVCSKFNISGYRVASDARGNPTAVLTNWMMIYLGLAGYFYRCLRRTGQTLAQRWLGMMVIAKDGGPISRSRSIARTVLKMTPLLPVALWEIAESLSGPFIDNRSANEILPWISGIPGDPIYVLVSVAFFFLVALPIALPPQKKGLHDFAAGTTVRRTLNPR